MLNRRLLRTKAVQALYARQLTTDANRLLALDHIEAAFQPDLNSMEPQNRTKLAGMRKLAAITLDEFIKHGKPNEDEELPEQVIKVARSAFEAYSRQTISDGEKMVRRVLNETESIYVDFIRVLSMLIELSHQAKIDRERRYDDPEAPFPKDGGLDSNSVIKVLVADKTLEEEIIRNGISWSNEMNLIRKIYREALRKDEEYTAYCKNASHTPEEDQAIVQYVLRQVILKHEVPLDYLEQRDLYWVDHSELIRSLAIKTLRSADNSATFQLSPLTKDWEEDRFFVEELCRIVVAESDQYDVYLDEHLKNWELDRIALVDLIILKTALAELIHFPGIPVKVTINEFIEIAKRYSTPKSGKFVNGVLDVLSVKLAKEGVIRKSGRGLIDNK
ncbi:transcription antitermination factor NusB [Dyadobacter fanqingshengii]|uniref:Transcription antitermination protein NusB n=1 Tax=Dyadobacter fanqingshengii TaxID=2906443 RepID=A0A9X1TFE2_9BACT|nr:transcription antitermination factor NusB [Dyadobacter fanqingshengii]MCF0039412.1 transcription antitermination factor NusB [Dyadobacter fanqingshengii]MCF2503046.1 transcription antitermination factor NusB [Dyadobacter fanqingshengii]USJ33775.1 transcription antitermination factor NusB [Dyadobacter fanqingshengii]